MNLYADYEYYATTYKGNLLKEEFEKSIMKASAYVRRITFGRADDNTEMDEVKLAACAVCELLANDDKVRSKHSGRAVASENTDGYSVSYESGGNGETADELLGRKIFDTLELYLMPTELLYMGVES
ncbi:hypothetical protein LIQ95_11765 [[Ruminococcus] gnavus]|uniref:hypothetical protein n=1 Tax=Mediterraneibacter gnavus TaxID=33038 RepID=UPI001D05A159|nr:hypothetical protein [Mediterraneibacter gnavus]MCB5652865.1 hypothetical protein [Mediterraneibacter gnavus]